MTSPLDNIARLFSDFQRAIESPARQLNDAVMQAGRALDAVANSPAMLELQASATLAHRRFADLTAPIVLSQPTLDMFARFSEPVRFRLPVLDYDALGATALAVERIALAFQPLEIETERFRQYLESAQLRIEHAAGEHERAAVATEVIVGALDGFGLDIDVGTVRARAKLLVQVVLLFWWLLNLLNSSHREAMLSAELRDVRRVEREHADSIDRLFEAFRELKNEVEQQPSDVASQTPTQLLKVRRKAILRRGPSGKAHRVVTLSAGTRLQLIGTYERWRFVEVVQSPAALPIRGWVYQRNVADAPALL